MDLQDYPSLYQAYDSCAIKAQKRYFRLVKAKIGLLIGIALFTSFTWNQDATITFAGMALVLLLLVGIFLGFLMDLKKFDHVWFICRAIAESIAEETWRFMMKVDYYDDAITNSEANTRFINRMKEILNLSHYISSQITVPSNGDAQITKKMTEIRNKTLKERRDYYIQNRIKDQKIWYATKARWNRNKEFQFFLLTWFLEFAAVIVAVVVVYYSPSQIQPVGIITTAAAGAMSWMYSQSYRELSQSYSLTAQELSLLEAQANQATTEEELTRIILDVERAISREHTIWVSKRLADRSMRV